MRLAVLGPANGNKIKLRERAQFAMQRLAADRIVYLGIDGLIDEVVRDWAAELVGADPSDQALWKRALEACGKADHKTIDVFLQREQQRSSLKKLVCLPHVRARTIEMLQGILAVLIFDKAYLDEEDILPATLLVFGKGNEPLVHRVGQRTFLSPGPLTHPQGGMLLLAKENSGIYVSIFNSNDERVRHESVAALARGAKLTVQGSES